MKYLFVHQNFPAQYVHLLRRLAARGQDEILFLTENNRAMLDGVRKVVRRVPRAAHASTHRDAQDFELACIRAQAVAGSGEQLKSLGFVPDIVIGHHGWGELLNVQDVWPNVPLLGYYEFYYNETGFDVGFDPEFPLPAGNSPRVRTKNAVNLIALNSPGHGQTPTDFQLSTYPDWATPRISVLREGVDLDICRPNPAISKKPITLGGYKVAPEDKLVTYVARDLEPYRGFHVMMRALPRLLAARPDIRVIMVGGDGVSYGAKSPVGTWRERMMGEIGDRVDWSRVHFVGKVPYEGYIKLLQRSDAHVYLTYPFVTSWSLREALATGCALVGSNTAPVQEFVQHRKTGLLTPFHNPEALADSVLELLENRALSTRLRRYARAWAEKHLDMKEYLENYEKLIADVIEGRV